LERIGQGSFGEVFRAYDPSLQREVALKLLSPDRLASAAAVDRYLTEARCLARVRYPNVLVIHGADRHDDRVGLWTDLVRGQTLEESLTQRGPFGADEAMMIGLDLCRALAAVHAAGLVHRDVKAANVMREQGGRIILMDFGAVGDRSGGTLAPGGEGSPITMAPEQLAGRTVAASTDIYGLGALLYRLVSGRYPIEASSLAELRAKHAGGAFVPLRDLRPDLPGEFLRVVERALDHEPERRFASAGEMERALASCLGQPGPAITIPASSGRRGARLAVPVALALAVLAAAVSQWMWRQRARATPGRIESIAVLPLQNLSGDESQDYFAEGMTDELITELSKIGALRAISRHSVMGYRGTKKGLREIARELKVDAMVEGAVLRADGKVRISAALIAASSERQLWAERYEGEIRDVLKLQANVAQAIARQVRAQVTPEEHARLASARAVNPRAHEACLKGQFLLDRVDGTNFRKALEHFQAATDLDPAYAAAWAGMADAYYLLSSLFLPAHEAMPRARAAAQRALEIDPQFGPAHAVLGIVQAQYDWAWADAEASLRRAIALSPSSATAHFYFGQVLYELGRFAESRPELRRAHELDPLSMYIAIGTYAPEHYGGRVDEALAGYRALARQDPRHAIPPMQIALCYAAKQRYAEAIVEAERAVTLDQGPYTLSALGWVYARAGRERDARRVLERLSRAQQGNVQNIQLAKIYGALGMTDTAFALMEKAVENRDEELTFLKIDPQYAALRSDPRFAQLLRRVNLGP
jgi:TolB-like protein/Flp pilus assembly protein TadD